MDLPAAAALCHRDPVGTILAATRLEIAWHEGLGTAGGEVWGFERDGELIALCWAGANLVPVGADPAALDGFAELARRQGRRCSSIVGERSAVLGLWERLRSFWPEPREVRGDQPSLIIDHDPHVPPDPEVRRARPDEFDLVLPASIAMFTEEVGYSPVTTGRAAYEARVRSLIEAGRSFVRITETPEGPRVLFKAELGAVCDGVAQVQGVWVPPDHRGRRLSEGGMATVVQITRQDVAPVVSLYVNQFNLPALASYRRVGFREVGAYATVLF